MRIVATAAAAVVGFYVGGPAGALQAAAFVYGATGFLDPNQKVKGPRLDDLKGPQASYGAPISYIEGAPRLAGCIVYASEKREIATTQTQGKGGPGVDSTTFTYEIDLLYLMATNSCDAVIRVFSNGKLVWSQSPDADDESVLASGTAPSWRDMRFYDGNPDQLPDPTYEAAVGVGEAPAYRGRTTIFIEGLNLGNSGQLPVLTFEVSSAATPSAGSIELARVPQKGQYNAGTPAMRPGGFEMLTGEADGVNFRVSTIEANGESAFGSFYLVHNIPLGNYTTVTGCSDVSALYVVGGPANETVISQLRQGGYLEYDLSLLATAGLSSGLTVCQKGNTVLFGGAIDAIDGCIVRFNLAGSTAPLAQSDDNVTGAWTSGWNALATDETTVWGIDFDCTAVYVFDAATLTLQDTLAMPPLTAIQNAYPVLDEDGELYCCIKIDSSGEINRVYHWNGASWDVFRDDIGDACATAAPGNSHSWSYNDGAFMACSNVYEGGSDNFGGVFMQLTRSTIVRPTLVDVVSRLCLSTGQLTAGDIDVTALADVVIGDGDVWAMAVSQVSSRRAVLEMLQAAYLFDCVENEKLVFVPRGGDVAVTIPYEHLGAGDAGDTEPLPMKRLNDMEVPARITIKYANVLNDFQDGAETGERLVVESTAVSVVELALGLRPADAKKVADVNTMDAAVDLLRVGPIALPRDYAALEPTDVIEVTAADGSTFRCRIVKGTLSGGVCTFELVLDDATVINSEASTDDDYASSNLVRSVGTTLLEVMDVAPLRAADGSPGEYYAVTALGTWPGAEVDTSPDDVTFAKIADVNTRATVGAATTALGDWAGGNVFDEVNTVTVNVGEAGTLSSSTRDTLLAGEVNAMLIGDEIIQFTTATLGDPGVYTLTGFLRALRGTEAHTGTHAIGDRVVLLTEATLRRLVEDQGDVGALKYWKAVTYGKSRDSAVSEAITYEGVGLLPFAPVDIRLGAEDTGAVITWNRRDRLFSRFLAEATDPPMSEATEEYDYELRDGSDVLIDSGTVTEAEYEVTSLFGGQYLSSMWGMRQIATGWFAVRDDFVSETSTNHQLVELDADFVIVDQSTAIGSGKIAQYVENDPDAYVLAHTFYPPISGLPTIAQSTDVFRYTSGSLASGPVATHTASAPLIYNGVCYDGANVWVSEREAGGVTDLLRKLHPTTLASVATYNLTAGDYPGVLFYRSGKIWVACGVGDVVRFGVAGLAEDLRITVLADIGAPTDLYDNGTILVVLGQTKIGTYNRTTGALLYVHDALPMTNSAQKCVAEHLGYVVVAVGTDTGKWLLLIDGTTGNAEFVRQPEDYLYAASGSDGTSLYITASPFTPQAARTRAYVLASPDLSGYSFTVWQKSAVVGRGYPGTATLP
jgi:hypothetical protein